jgi:tetratricopeptide (TPR) repeat protein
MSIKSIQLNGLSRLILLVAVVGVVFLTYLGLRWTFGKTLAQQADQKEIAELSTRLAPNDPQTYYALAVLNERSLLPEDLKKALENYEKAVSIAPNDFRLWLALGKARERSGDVAGAEKALQKAVEFAPNYAEVRWTWGNFLLRQGKENEAFSEISKAVVADEKYANPAVNLAWQIYDGDLNQISQKVGDSTAIKAQLSPFLVKQKRFDEAFNFWNSIPDEEKKTTYRKNGEEFFTQLVEAKSFRNALTVQSQIAKPDEEKFSVGVIFNPDFEQNVKPANASVFDWKLGEAIQPQISLDASQKQSGGRSLIMLFNSADGKQMRTVDQIVAVESGKNYKVEGFYRSDLKGLGVVKLEILDATDNKVLASADARAVMKDWSSLAAEFSVPANSQGIIIRLGSVACKSALCPVSGKIWFDNFSLK